jgi:hypothetical protein
LKPLVVSCGLSVAFFIATFSARADSSFAYNGAVQTYTITQTGTYIITASGASGGSDNLHGTFSAGGLSATLSAEFLLSAGTILDIAVGGSGSNTGNLYGAGGGGGTWIVTSDGTPLLIVGGGGGAGENNRPGGNVALTLGSLGSSPSADANNGNDAGNGGGFTGPGSNTYGGQGWPSLTGGGDGGYGGGGGGDDSGYYFTGGGGGGATGGISGHRYVIQGGFGNGGQPGQNYSASYLISAIQDSVVGDGFVDVAAATPEPSNCFLLISGIAGIFLIKRRKTQLR